MEEASLTDLSCPRRFAKRMTYSPMVSQAPASKHMSTTCTKMRWVDCASVACVNSEHCVSTCNQHCAPRGRAMVQSSSPHALSFPAQGGSQCPPSRFPTVWVPGRVEPAGVSQRRDEIQFEPGTDVASTPSDRPVPEMRPREALRRQLQCSLHLAFASARPQPSRRVWAARLIRQLNRRLMVTQ